MISSKVATADESRGHIERSLSETVATMRRVLSDQFGVDIPDFSEGSELSTLGLDSIGFFEYTFALESALHVNLADLPRELATTGDFIRFVHGEVVRQAAEAGPQ